MKKSLLDILACPLCQNQLFLQQVEEELVCLADGLAFPIRNDIPILLEHEARKLSAEDVAALRK